MQKKIAILEDDPERSELMLKILAEKFPQYQGKIFDNAPEIIQFLRTFIQKICAISLDHDLPPTIEKNGKAFDPGCGRDVTDFLKSIKPSCSVIIHTSNYFAGSAMKSDLEETGWIVKTVAPFGDITWIRDDWADCLAELLQL